MGHEILFSALTGLSTLIGTLLVLWFNLKRRMIALALGFSSGVMLFVSYFSLLPVAIKLGGLIYVYLGIFCSILFMFLIHKFLSKFPHKHENENSTYTRLGMFLVVAIIAHNLPEGAAIGIGFHAEHHMGVLLAIALAIHNIPEGIGLAVPLIAARKNPFIIIGLSLLCAIVMPIGAWIGIHFLAQSVTLISGGLTFAAAVMIWIVICEVCPQAFALNRFATFSGLALGAFFMYMIQLLH